MTQKHLPLVSIIIPSFNSMKWVRKTLSSILDSNYRNIEIVWVDDHSTDDSFACAKTILADKPNTRLLVNQGKGAQSARNYGLIMSSGTFVKFMDADDCISYDLIQNQVMDLLEHPLSLSKCNWNHFTNEPGDGSHSSAQLCDHSYMNGATFLADLWNQNMYPLHAWLIPKTILTDGMKWDENLTQNQDGEYFARLCFKADKIIHSSGTAFYRRPMNENLSQKTGVDQVKSQVQVLQTYRSLAIQAPRASGMRGSFNCQVNNVAYRCACNKVESILLKQVLDMRLQGEKNYNIIPQSTRLRFLSALIGAKATLRIRSIYAN
tara:strand:- start:1429 stop:2391 length:963 start_codon:yes stop_codon:yes gene_type:complete